VDRGRRPLARGGRPLHACLRVRACAWAHACPRVRPHPPAGAWVRARTPGYPQGVSLVPGLQTGRECAREILYGF